MIQTLAIANYRSLRRFVAPLKELTLVTGANGTGKSNVYRALRLLAETAQGGLIASLTREGGLQSTLWAGPESIGNAVKRGEHPVEGTVRKEPVSLGLGFATEDFGYAMDLGLPIPRRSSRRSNSFPAGRPSSSSRNWARPASKACANSISRPGTGPRDRGGARTRGYD